MCYELYIAMKYFLNNLAKRRIKCLATVELCQYEAAMPLMLQISIA